MNAPNTAIAERERSPIEGVKNTLAKRADEFRMVLPSHISVEKFQRTIATAVLANPKLLECDRQSLLLASMKLAQDALLPDGREAALVPFKQSFKEGNQWKERWLVQPIPMVYGLRKKILQSGEVLSIEVGVVYRCEIEQGHFVYEIGLTPPVRHRPKWDMTDEEASEDNIAAAYSIARIRNGDADPLWSVEVMSRRDINKVRESSQTGALRDRNGKARQPKGPWADWFGEMAKKTVMRRHSKVLPMSGDILDALNRDDEELQARGVSQMLSVEEKQPLVLPGEGEGAIDAETGEVTEDEPEREQATGMSEVDEETARQLDAGTDQAEPRQESENPAPAEAEESSDERILRETRAKLAAASTIKGIDLVDAEWTNKYRVLFDDAVASEVDQEINAKRNAVREAKK